MKYAVITDDRVAELYGNKDIPLFSFPAGESSKTRATKEKLEDQLFSHGYSRDTTLIALGGGVVMDLAGFLASTFCRGVDLILVPTTLLAMVDASIGGKTGVNTELGKNLIGSIYFPKAVILNLGFLKTLPEKEWFNGWVEILKAGLIADRALFEGVSLEESIRRAIEIKRRLVARDPYEKDARKLLNLGHTIGHAIETLSHYQISHGEAVAAGIVLESRLAREMGILDPHVCEIIEKRFPAVSFPFSPEEMVEVMSLDKKSVDGKPRFVLLKEIGEPLGCLEVPLDILKKVLYDAALCPC